MKRKKDISDLIRDNQHKLNERPSPRAWQRLESKLDNQRSRHKTSIYKQFAMVAAVIALVAVASLISITVNNQQSANKSIMAEADTSPISLPVQELETVYTDANEDLHKVVEFQRSLKRIYASNPNPIKEGTQHKKVIAANDSKKNNNTNTITRTRTADNAIAMNDVTKESTLKSRKPVNTPSESKKIAKAKETEITPTYNYDAVVSDATSDIVYSEPEPVQMEEAELNAKIKKKETTTQATSSTVATSAPSPSPTPTMIGEEKNNTIPWYMGNWKYNEALNKGEKIQIVQSGDKVQLIVNIGNIKDVFYDFESGKNNSVTFRNVNPNESYTIRIESGKYLIYKNDQDYGLLIEREE